MDNLTKEQRRKNMQNIRSKGTLPEQKVMRDLQRRKIYFAKHVDSIIGKPDILFRRRKIAVFIDSDFWHGHPKRFIMPKTNLKYWKNKIDRNKDRDKEVNRELRKMGFKVIRIWEYDIKKNYNKVLNRILRATGHVPKLDMQAN
jgi:DNA mismatch endonuclease (patch repair protein)|tara:strand:+ start:63 stop:494 length:432 start_codon:yes stop_codon:yes gene_type:complete